MLRLSDDKARQLSSLVWRERLRRFLPLVLAAMLLVGIFTAVLLNQARRSDATVDVKVREATVVHVKQVAVARGAAIITVHLDADRDVDAFSTLQPVPAVGAHVEVNEARHASGRLTYEITRVKE
jgi:hypothetical protein